jgi:hypothetical protein
MLIMSALVMASAVTVPTAASRVEAVWALVMKTAEPPPPPPDVAVPSVANSLLWAWRSSPGWEKEAFSWVGYKEFT